MATQVLDRIRREKQGEPTWEIALLYPCQGTWSEEEYFELDTGRMVEFTKGRLEFLPMPTKRHQLIVLYLVNALRAYAGPRNLGEAVMAPFPVRIKGMKYREPDVAFLASKHANRDKEQYWDGADLVMEVVSSYSAARDLRKKRREYTQARIPEYWIVDPQEDTITVLKLTGDKYTVHGEFAKGAKAASALLPGYEVDVKAALEAK